MGDWYDMDAAWHVNNFPWGPVAARKAAAERMIHNLEAGKPLLHVKTRDPARPRRLLLLAALEQRPPTTVYWTFRTWIPYNDYLDVVKRVAIMTQDRAIVYSDPTSPPILELRTLTDRIRLLTMFVRWRDAVSARREARFAMLRICLLRLGWHKVVKLLVDRGAMGS